uniref:Uncharacterized protein n=1 Tax=Rhizophora mucronata TaxID=61149 RepID=A0A2P2PVK4_RHIMU
MIFIGLKPKPWKFQVTVMLSSCQTRVNARSYLLGF